ncbi:GntR family transcriptional regulator [Shimia sp. MMG029]|uniref:GntR family transcriptional regulator n=1 Tax=Shimia sp. MMG029 TaxID=3021978 RepID=UPI0022FE1BE1|nr:GntR family transcriptional regulator [Shimia sp. MMG029]MDA5557728.1 GntR family transcriptional regulator [Shimia sp. MMG029]
MSAPKLSKIDQQPATLRDMVQERMREAIVEGLFQPGERLVERPLCEQLGVSRTVVRETIRYLEAEGLVEILPGHGPIVAVMRWEDARQIYGIRRLLETAAAEQCARNIDADISRKLEAALKRLQEESVGKTRGSLFRATSDFYQQVFRGAEHHIAWDIVERLNGRISRLRMLTLTSTQRRRPGIAYMEDICAAVVSGNPEAARIAVECHLDAVAAIAERVFASEGDLQ